MVRQALISSLKKEEDIEVVGEASSGAELFAFLNDPESPSVDVIVLDLSLQDASGLELLKDLHLRFSQISVLVLSMYSERIYGERAIRAGARGYIMKEASFEEFLKALRQVARGEFYLSPDMVHLMMGHISGHRKQTLEKKLTDRELEVFRLIGQGLTTKEIAECLSLSPKTVDTYRERIKKKLNLKNSSELVQQAVLWFKRP